MSRQKTAKKVPIISPRRKRATRRKRGGMESEEERAWNEARERTKSCMMR